MICQVCSEHVCLSKEVKGKGAKVLVTVGSNQNEDKQCDRLRIPMVLVCVSNARSTNVPDV